mgnify:CR=1 FL=1
MAGTARGSWTVAMTRSRRLDEGVPDHPIYAPRRVCRLTRAIAVLTIWALYTWIGPLLQKVRAIGALVRPTCPSSERYKTIKEGRSWQ